MFNCKYKIYSMSLKLNQWKYYWLKQWRKISNTLMSFKRALYLKNVIILFANYLYKNINVFTKPSNNIF